MPEVYVAAGSNVRPREHLRRALSLLAAAYPDLATSAAYANPAAGFVGDDFVNLAARFSTGEPLETVLARLKSIERECGREPGAPRWGPRTLDLDLLLYGDETGRRHGATLPHPDLATRAWVLGPLAELAPRLRHPANGETMAALWRRFDRAAHPLTPVSLGDPA